MPKFDAVASLRIWAVEVDLDGGQTLRIPPLAAVEWLPHLMAMNILGVLDLVEDPEIDEALLDGTLTAEQLGDALKRLVESAAGRSWWSASLLAAIAAEHWHMVGSDLARVGLRFESISLGAALDAIYGSLCRSMDEKGIVRLNAALERPPVDGVTEAPRPGPRDARPLPATAEQYVRVRPKTVLRRPQDRQGAPTGEPMPPLAPPSSSDPPASAGSPSAILSPMASP